jgi:glyceraldehyde 3-phosphate dehydrogenase
VAVRIGINGFGRIGMLAARAAMQSSDVEIIAINDTRPRQSLVFFKRDSIHGTRPEDVSADDSILLIGDREIKAFCDRDLTNIPWGDLGVDIVVEPTDVFTNREDAAMHLESGAKKVVISASAKDADATLVYKVNHETYNPQRHHVVSSSSCTTNCVVPMAKVLLDSFGMQSAYMTTCHAYADDQSLLDGAHEDFRRARSARLNIIPTSTGAARTVGVIFPELEGKVDGMALRVPVLDGSITDLITNLSREVSPGEVNTAFKEAAEGELEGVLEYIDAPLVSTDIIDSPASCIFDPQPTMTNVPLVKVFGWYDNEWGYSCRIVDLLRYIGERL